MIECSRAREHGEQCKICERVSGASKRASDPVLIFQFRAVLNHSAHRYEREGGKSSKEEAPEHFGAEEESKEKISLWVEIA